MKHCKRIVISDSCLNMTDADNLHLDTSLAVKAFQLLCDHIHDAECVSKAFKTIRFLLFRHQTLCDVHKMTKVMKVSIEKCENQAVRDAFSCAYVAAPETLLSFNDTALCVWTSVLPNVCSSLRDCGLTRPWWKMRGAALKLPSSGLVRVPLVKIFKSIDSSGFYDPADTHVDEADVDPTVSLNWCVRRNGVMVKSLETYGELFGATVVFDVQQSTRHDWKAIICCISNHGPCPCHRRKRLFCPSFNKPVVYRSIVDLPDMDSDDATLKHNMTQFRDWWRSPMQSCKKIAHYLLVNYCRVDALCLLTIKNMMTGSVSAAVENDLVYTAICDTMITSDDDICIDEIMQHINGDQAILDHIAQRQFDGHECLKFRDRELNVERAIMRNPSICRLHVMMFEDDMHDAQAWGSCDDRVTSIRLCCTDNDDMRVVTKLRNIAAGFRRLEELNIMCDNVVDHDEFAASLLNVIHSHRRTLKLFTIKCTLARNVNFSHWFVHLLLAALCSVDSLSVLSLALDLDRVHEPVFIKLLQVHHRTLHHLSISTTGSLARVKSPHFISFFQHIVKTCSALQSMYVASDMVFARGSAERQIGSKWIEDLTNCVTYSKLECLYFMHIDMMDVILEIVNKKREQTRRDVINCKRLFAKFISCNGPRSKFHALARLRRVNYMVRAFLNRTDHNIVDAPELSTVTCVLHPMDTWH